MCGFKLQKLFNFTKYVSLVILLIKAINSCILLLDLNDKCLSTTASQVTTISTVQPLLVKNYRLPKSIKPFFYDVTTMTNFDSLTEPESYNGTIEIHLSVNERTNMIIFHHVDLMIDTKSIKVALIDNRNTTVNVSNTSYDNETSLFTINLVDMLDISSNYSLSMYYVGKLLSNNYGFYKSSYTDGEGKKRLENQTKS